MNENYRSCYKTARISKGYTQEKAAELLNISVRALAYYEDCTRPVPDDILKNMVTFYSADWLPLKSLQEKVVGIASLPKFKENAELAESYVNLVDELEDVYERLRPIRKIVKDNKIDELEKPQHDEFLKEIDELLSAILQYKYATRE